MKHHVHQSFWQPYKEKRMRLQQNNRARVPTGNTIELLKHQSKKLVDTPYWELLVTLAALADEVADGGNSYSIIGSTQSGNSLTLTVYSEGDRATAYADTFDGLGPAFIALQTTGDAT